VSQKPNCVYCSSSNIVTTAPINGNPTWKCVPCGGLFSAIKRSPVTTTLGHATKLFAEYINANIASGMLTRDAVFNACRTLGINLSDEKLHNLIVSVEEEQQRLIEAKDMGMDVAAGQVIQQVDPEEHDEMRKKAIFVNDSYSVKRVK
jgi:hypothetical protein